MTNDDRKSIVDYELHKARLNYEQAGLAKDNHYWDLVANRLYYALFHAVSALLIHNEIPVKSHKGAVVMFNKHCVKTGLVPVEEGYILSYLQSKREEADYNCFTEIKQSDIEPIIEKSLNLINLIESFIKSDIRLIQDDKEDTSSLKTI